MNILKTTLTTFVLFFTVSAFSQTKDETIKYISDLYSKSSGYTDTKTNLKHSVESVKLDNRTLSIKHKISDGNEIIRRLYLMDYKLPLVVKKVVFTNVLGDSYGIYDSSDESIFSVSVENDAKRLKNALEHLIEILKKEPNNDPFAD